MTTAFALAVAATGGSAYAMTTPPTSSHGCTVAGAEDVVSTLGGADALCAIVAKAIASSGHAASVHLELVNAHAAVARATVAGRKLSERRIDTLDRPLNGRAIESLADAIANQLRALGHSSAS